VIVTIDMLIMLGSFKHIYVMHLVSLKPAYALIFTVISVAMVESSINKIQGFFCLIFL
jgi:hypothetical protein